MRRIMLLVALTLLAMGAIAGTASAAHFGNNQAKLSPKADPNATGQAIVNYSDGRGTFNGTTTVRNLSPGETYTFVVRLGGNEASDQVICSGEANRQGVFRCSEQDLALAGFDEAVIEDAAGNDVASGIFARRGNCREPDQAGSQCEANSAPGQQKGF